MTAETIAAPVAPVQLSPLAAYSVPLERIRPSPYNPRKRFAEAGLEDLADSIAAHGVQQAIVVREVAPVKAGGADYEIVAGERRWRASNVLARRGGHQAPHTIPAFVRELDDFQAREIALTENSHRNDLHPLEEAEAYANLLLKQVGGGDFKPPRVKGYTVEQLAEKIGHKPNFVFGRLKLLELVPAAKEAFLDDKLQLKIAEALARMPAKEQERALPELLRGWGGEPYTHRQAIEHLRTRYMLKLKAAVFHITDPDLVPAAGPCTTCPKRSGANPDLFNGASSEDMCLDAACFKAKEEAHSAEQLEKARKAGQAVVTGAAVKKQLGIDHTSNTSLQAKGFVNLDQPAESLTGTKKTLRSLLGKDFTDATVIKGEHDTQPITVAKESAVKAALKQKGLLKPSTPSSPGAPGKVITAADIKAKRAGRIRELLERRLPGAMCKHFDADGSEGLPEGKVFLLELVRKLYDACEMEFDELELAITGSKSVGNDWMVDLKEEQLARAVMVMLVADAVSAEAWGRNDGTEEADTLAGDLAFKLPDLRQAIAEEVDTLIEEEISALATAAAEVKAKPPKKAAPKKVPGKAKQLTPEKALATAVAQDAKAR